MQSAIASAQPGDSFLLKRGDTWNEMLVMPHPVNGSAGHPITIGNYGVGAIPVIDGHYSVPQFIYARATGRTATPLWSYITVDGVEVRNMSSMAIEFYQNKGGSAGMPGIVIKNCNVHNTGPAADVGAANCVAGYCNQIMFLDENQRPNGTMFLGNIVYACGGHNCYELQNDLGGPQVDGNTCNGPWNHECLDLKNDVGAIVQNNRCNGDGASAGHCYYFENKLNINADITWRYNTATNANGFGAAAAYPVLSTVTAHIYDNVVRTTQRFSAVTTGKACTDQRLILDVHNNEFGGASGNVMYWPLQCPAWSLSNWNNNHVDSVDTHIMYQGVRYHNLASWQGRGFGQRDVWGSETNPFGLDH
jgi:hypothetical protein